MLVIMSVFFKHDRGRSWPLIAGGIALFAITGLAGFWWTTSGSGSGSGSPTVVPEYSGMVVTDGSEETSRSLAETTTHDETVRAEQTVDDPAEIESLGLEPSTGANRSGTDGNSFVTLDTGETTPDDEPAAVPREVIDDGFLSRYVDFDNIVVADVPDDFSFDLCAGSNPFSEPIPGCPHGTGATIVPVDDEIYYSVSWFTDSSCASDDDTLRLPVRASRPSRLSVSAWNHRAGEATGRQPARAPDRSLTIESTAEEIEAWSSDAPADVHFCVEISGLEHGLVHISFEGRSALSGEADLVDGQSLDLPWYSSNLSRPPTTARPLTADMIYVKTYRRSSDDQQTFVQARVYGEQSCDNGGDVSLVESNPDAVQSVLDTTLELDTAVGGWPWDPAWDRVDLHRLRLETGKIYLLCTYWVESNGPSFEPDRVVRSEVMLAVAPDLATMTVSLDSIHFVGLEDDPRINEVSVIPTQFGVYGCRGARRATNSAETDSYFFGPDPLCEVTSPGRELERGGFTVETRAVDSLGDTYSRTVFVRIADSDVLCTAPCPDVVRQVALPLPYVPKREITGSADWPGSFDSSAIPPDGAGEEGLPAGSVVLDLRFVSTGYDWWGLDEFREVDQTAAALPARPRFDLDISPTSDESTLSASAEFEVVADRDVSVDAEITGPGGGDACTTAAGSPLTHTNSALSDHHVFEITGLCVAEQYEIHITAADETGTAGEVTSRPSPDDEQVVPFGTPGIDVQVDAELVVNGGPPASGSNVFHLRHTPQFDILSLIPGYRSATPTVGPPTAATGPLDALADEQARTGWAYNVPYNDVMCDASGDGSLTQSYPRQAIPSQRDWPVQTTADGIRFMFQVEYGMAPLTSASGLRWASNCTSDFTPSGVFSIDEVLSLDQLREGVEFESEDGYFTVSVRSR
jgi:hypothetical protein